MSDCSTTDHHSTPTDHHSTPTHPLIYPSILNSFSPCQFSMCVLPAAHVCECMSRAAIMCHGRFLLQIHVIDWMYIPIHYSHDRSHAKHAVTARTVTTPGRTDGRRDKTQSGKTYSSQILNTLYFVPAFSALTHFTCSF